MGKPGPTELDEREKAVLHANFGLDTTNLVGHQKCKVGRLTLDCKEDQGPRWDSSHVMYAVREKCPKENSSRTSILYGRVRSFLCNPNHNEMPYAVIRRFKCRGECISDLLDRPHDQRLADEWQRTSYGTNYKRVDHDGDDQIDFVPCINIMKHAVLLNVPVYGTYVCSVPLAYIHD